HRQRDARSRARGAGHLLGVEGGLRRLLGAPPARSDRQPARMKPEPRERLLADLFDALWARYRSRVPYARAYEQLVAEQGGTFVNDHIAFRTFAWDKPAAGIFKLARPFEALGYVASGCYTFPDKHLVSIHLAHPSPALPKLFVSELR